MDAAYYKGRYKTAHTHGDDNMPCNKEGKSNNYAPSIAGENSILNIHYGMFARAVVHFTDRKT